MSMRHVLGIGEYAVTSSPEDVLVTHALGSCIALLVFCPQSKVAAMAHIALPERLEHASMGRHKDAYFADEAVPLLLNTLQQRFLCKPQNLVVHLIGGAVSRSEKDPFQVGKRNLEAIKQMLNARQMRYTAVDVGGHFSRTVTFEVETGSLEVRSQQMML